MIVREDLSNGYVRIKSDERKMIVRVSDGMDFTEAIVKKESAVEFAEKEYINGEEYRAEEKGGL